MSIKLYALKEDLDMVVQSVQNLQKGYGALDYIVGTIKKIDDEQTCQSEQMKRMEAQQIHQAERMSEMGNEQIQVHLWRSPSMKSAKLTWL